jgi:putative glutamine amidotransferase
VTARPLIAVPARFSAGASALRYAAEVNARALIEAVWRAGGEPATIHPAEAPAADIAARLGRFDGVLLPGGGDIAPAAYCTGSVHGTVYDVDPVQDAFDLAVARMALAAGLPMLAVCRGLQIVNVAFGGTLEQDMGGRQHRHVMHEVRLVEGSVVAKAMGVDSCRVSCYHHQRVDRLGAGLTATAAAADGTIEAVELLGTPGWFAGVQWHPEDTASHDPASQSLFDEFVRASNQHNAG